MQIDDSFDIDPDRGRRDRAAGRLTLDFDTFAWSALADESAALGVSIDELARFSVLYYVSDRDSGRIARRLPRASHRAPWASRGARGPERAAQAALLAASRAPG